MKKSISAIVLSLLYVLISGFLYAQGGKDCAEAEALANRIDKLPFAAAGESTCNMGDDYKGDFINACPGANPAKVDGEDKVYVFTAEDEGLVTIIFTAVPDTTGAILVYEGGCPYGAGIGIIGNTNDSPVKILSFDVMPGKTYYILIDGGFLNPLTNTDCLLSYELSISEPNQGCKPVIPIFPNADRDIGFEDGNASLLKWTGGLGSCCPISTPIQGMDINNRHTIMSDPMAKDPQVNIPVLAPGGGNYSLRLGNAVNGAEAEIARYKFEVTDQTNGLIYHYAFVLEDGGHPEHSQPRFEASLFDENDVRVPCTFYKAIAGKQIPCTRTMGLGQNVVVYKDWTSVAVDLSAYTGDSLFIAFGTGDCADQGHFGYAYVDVVLTKFVIDVKFCEGDSIITLTAPPGFKDYLWSTGATSQAITVIHPVAGTAYSVTLTPFNSDTCQTVLQTILDPFPAPLPDFTASKACIGDSVYFTDLSTVATPSYLNAWYWDFGDGTTSNLQNPSHYYTAAGTYTVTLKAGTNNGCISFADTQQVEVSSFPVPSFAATNPCLEEAVQFEDKTSIGTGTLSSWHWDFGDGTTSADQNPSHKYASGGMYAVSLKVFNSSGCADSISKDIILKPSPKALFNFVPACAGDTVWFSDQSKGGTNSIAIDSWNWDFGDGSTFSGRDTGHIYTAGGDYEVRLIVTDQNGCKDTLSKTVSVHAAPVAAFSAPHVCLHDPVPFNDSSLSATGTISAWHWDFGDSTISSEQNPLHLYKDPGTYLVKLSVTDMQGCKSATQKSIVIDPPLTLSMSEDTTIKLGSTAEINSAVSGGSGQYNHLWNPAIGNGAGPHEVMPEQLTVYNLQVSDAAGPCPDVSGRVQVNVIDECEIQPFSIPNAFTPNGDRNNDQWIVSSPCIEYYEVRVYDRWGALAVSLSSLKNEGWNGGWMNELSKLCPPGAYVYIIEYRTKKGELTKDHGTISLTY